MSSTELDRLIPGASAVSLPSDQEIDRMWRVATALAKSGMFKDIKQGEQAFAKMVIGRDLGLTPAQSMTGLYLVEGKPQVAAPLMGHFIRAQKGYDWEVLTLDDMCCEILFTVEGREDRVSKFTIEDAKQAGLTAKDVWKKYPRNMLFSRAMSNGAKWYVPEAMNGLPVYAEGELEGAGRMRDGGEDGGVRSSSPEDRNALLDAIIDTIPLEQQERARDLIDEQNRLAPHSWSAAKVELVFRGKSGYATSVELAAIESAIEELRARQPLQVGDAVDEAEVVESAEGVATEEELETAERIRQARIAELEQALAADSGLSEQQRSNVEAELDALTGPPLEGGDSEPEV